MTSSPKSPGSSLVGEERVAAAGSRGGSNAEQLAAAATGGGGQGRLAEEEEEGFLLPFDANQEEDSLSVKYNGNAVWKKNDVRERIAAQDLDATLGIGKFREQVEKLMNPTRVGLRGKEFTKFVVNAGGNREWASYVAQLTNLDRPKVMNPTDQSEMFYQQLIFSPISGLFYCFDPLTYTANEKVSSGFLCRSLTWASGSTANRHFTCMPDAAILAANSALVLGTMELKKCERNRYDEDIFNCVLLTAISAVAMVKYDVAGRVAIPFVVNVGGETASLYVTIMAKNMKAPRVELLSHARMDDRAQRVRCVAELAVLLHKLKVAMNRSNGQSLVFRVTDYGPRLAEETSRKHNRSRDRGGGGGGSSKKQRSAGPGGGTNAAEEVKGPNAAEEMKGAEAFASCEGRVEDVAPYRTFFRREPPYYFVGKFRNIKKISETHDATMPVFLKVWRHREDDSSTSPNYVKLEAELLAVAHQNGVPCPALVPELTAHSVSAGDHQMKFHRLAMQRLADDPVVRPDLLAYAESLINAVLQLHRIGVLHCDIKPSNVVWDASSRGAYLVDFGHAQYEIGATAYTGTEGYTAPQVQQRLTPHSRQSDAYSVGKTLLEVCRKAGVTTDSGAREENRRVLHVARSLSQEDPEERMVLENALAALFPSTAVVRATAASALAASPEALEGGRAGVAISPAASLEELYSTGFERIKSDLSSPAELEESSAPPFPAAARPAVNLVKSPDALAGARASTLTSPKELDRSHAASESSSGAAESPGAVNAASRTVTTSASPAAASAAPVVSPDVGAAKGSDGNSAE